MLILVLSILFLVAVISFPLCFSMYFSYHCLDTSTLFSILASFLPPSFLDTYSVLTSSLRRKALCMVISFLVLWSICLRSSLVHFKNGPGYLTRRSARVFIPFIRYLLYSFVSSIVLVLLKYSFLIFSFISTCLMVSAFNISKYLNVSFSSSVLIFS